MTLSVVFLVSGIALLVKGADYLVDGSSAIASRLGISTLIIGLTVVAFGTSAPELAVNIFSSLSGKTAVAVGNINGSNIANILLILGAASIIARDVPIKRQTVLMEIPFMAFASFLFVVLMVFDFMTGTSASITRIDGMILAIGFAVFLFYLYISAKSDRKHLLDKGEIPKYGLFVASGYSVMGLIGLILGGTLTVNGATAIASAVGVSDNLVALTVVAIGTSLPELVTSVVAARKGQTDLMVGGVVGSNIFNILLVIGLTSILSPGGLPIGPNEFQDAWVAFAVMFLLMIITSIKRFTPSKKDDGLDFRTGALLVVMYIGYLVFAVIRG